MNSGILKLSFHYQRGREGPRSRAPACSDPAEPWAWYACGPGAGAGRHCAGRECYRPRGLAPPFAARVPLCWLPLLDAATNPISGGLDSRSKRLSTKLYVSGGPGKQ